jgi:drug/metabolite transporter (DMT)-like permease
MTQVSSSSSEHVPGRIRATVIGGTAVLLWSTLALLTTVTGQTPPFLLVSLSFGIAFAIALVKWVVFREPVTRHLRQPAAVWLLGIYGLFGYHFFYFLALRNAPAVDASLIAYLWPLLIVVLSAFLPGDRLRWWHVAGAVSGLIGTGLLVTKGGSLTLRSEFLLGYGASLACAVIWATYSVANRRFASVPTDAVGGMCGATALLAAICHVVFETTVWPQGAEWLAVIALGIGPVGLAFYVWDHGTKHGDIRLLGVSSYAAPLISTIILVVAGKAAATWIVATAALLIVGGAALASLDVLRASGKRAPS